MATRLAVLLTRCVLTMLALASCTSDTDRPNHDVDRASMEQIPTLTPTPVPTIASAPAGELTISLEPVDERCAVGADFQGTARVRWAVHGGLAPYEVWVNGQLQVGEAGVVDVACVGLRGADFRTWTHHPVPRPLTVVATAIDAGGVRASDLLLLERPRPVSDEPGNKTREFEGGVDTLTLELFAPAICDAQEWGRHSRIPFADTGVDDVTMEIEWRVSGGQPPYTVYLAGETFKGESERVRVQCRHFEDGVLDSGWISAAGFALDAEGAIGSGIVETYAIARSASGRDRSGMTGGRTYRLEGVLMTIPDGLSLERVRRVSVTCSSNDCMDATCADSTYSNVCEDFFQVQTPGAGLVVSFGYRTRQMHGRGRISTDWTNDEGIEAGSLAELEEMIDAWAESAGRPPNLAAARWVNPAPLRVIAYADPLVCDPSFESTATDDIGVVHIRVAGGAWVPTGIELEGRLVGLARGSGKVVTRVDCSREPGMHELLVNVHDLGPQTTTSAVETTAEMYFLPQPSEDGGLQLAVPNDAYVEPRPFHPTAYCLLGGTAKIAWVLVNSGTSEASNTVEFQAIAKPTQVWIDGERAISRASNSQVSIDYGEHWVDCPDELGLHTVVIEATDSSSPPNSVRYEYLIRVVESHPSRADWQKSEPTSSATSIDATCRK